VGIVLLLVGVALLALPGLVRPLGRRLAPSEWARLCAAGLGGGAALLELTLLLYAAPTVLRAAGAPLLASVCERMLGPLVPGGEAAGWAAAAAAATLFALAVVGARRAVRERRTLWCESGLGQHHDYGTHELVVLPTPELVAVSVPGVPRGQVVVSEGLVDALEPGELDAVLRHEGAHLDHGHDRYLLLATTLEHTFAFFPPLRRSTAALRVTLERWADEEAAGPTAESRRLLRNALLDVTSALVAEPYAAAFTSADTVLERIDALEHRAPRPSRLAHGVLYLPGAALAAVSAYALLTWSGDAQSVLAMAGTCYA
jgi:hypothetical protein